MKFPSAMVVVLAISPLAVGDPSPLAQQKPDLVQTVDQKLSLTPSQQAQVDPIVRKHRDEIVAIESDTALAKNAKRNQVRENLVQLKAEIKPYLTSTQSSRLDSVLGIEEQHSFFPDVGLQYQVFFPSGSEARSIFGDSFGYFGLGLGRAATSIGNRTQIGFSVSDFSIDNNGNKLFVLTPKAFAEYRVPIMQGMFAFGNLSLGPSYMDYSFNDPSGTHFGAKRLGATVAAEVGLRYGQFRFGLDYQEFTQPAGINFSGFQASVTWIAIRF